MRVICIVQARIGSTRFPSKTLADIAGRSMLSRVIARASRIPFVDDVVVATTTLGEDAAVAEEASRYGARPFRGDPTDVLDRFWRAARASRADAVVRITADCPLIDPIVSGRVVEALIGGNVDYVSNVHPPTYPDGLDTEACITDALDRAWREATRQSDREHVTPYMWREPDRFRLASVAHHTDLSAMRWTVDEVDDLRFVSAIYRELAGSHGDRFGLDEVTAAIEARPDLAALCTTHPRNAGYRHSLQADHER